MNKIIFLKNGQTAIIREAQKEDAGKMIEYLNLIAGESDYLTFGQGELSINEEIEESIIEEHKKADNQIMLIAKINDQIIANLNFTGGKRQRIRHTGEFGVSVLKEYWGNGIAKALIDCLIEWAKAEGIVTKINLRVREDNEKAKELYKKIGFIEEGRITREFYIKGKYYSSIIMGLEL